jgi:hypothetical protein
LKLVFDIEANALYPDVSKVWCLVAKDIQTGTIYKEKGFSPNLTVLNAAELLIGHNIINYDLPTLVKLHDWKPSPKCKLFDTVVVSRLLHPDRPGGHSLDRWGKQFGRYKPEHDDWSKFSPAMLHRCTEDVEINHLTFLELLEEMKK